MFMEQKRTLSLLVDNTPGLLSRVAGLFSRRGYNIETITAGVTADPRYTRMTVVLYCSDEMILEQIKTAGKTCRCAGYQRAEAGRECQTRADAGQNPCE